MCSGSSHLGLCVQLCNLSDYDIRSALNLDKNDEWSSLLEIRLCRVKLSVSTAVWMHGCRGVLPLTDDIVGRRMTQIMLVLRCSGKMVQVVKT